MSVAPISLLAVLAVAAAAEAATEPARFVESRLTFETDVIGVEVFAVDGDERRDLVIALEAADGRRLQLHRQAADGSFRPAPDWSQTLPAEVVAFGFLDVREEPGVELLLLTPKGILSVTFTRHGLQGNARVELRRDVFPELAETDDVVFWPWILDLDGDGRDELLLPEDDALAVYAVRGGGDGEARVLEREREVPCRSKSEDRPQAPRVIGIRTRDDEELVDVRALSLFTFDPSSLPIVVRPPLLQRERRWTLPHFGFWNGDKRPDAVIVDGDDVLVQLQREDGTFEEAKRVPQPRLEDDEKSRSFELVDFDGDGRSELVRVTRDRSGTEKEFEVVVFAVGDDAASEPQSRSALLFKASDAEVSFRDVDGDGFVDLVLRSVHLPFGISSLAATKIDVALEIYRGSRDGSLSRRPDGRFVRTYSPDELSRLSEVEIFHMSGDYDGDGRDDLLFMDEKGLLHLHALRTRGDGIVFDDDPLVPPYQPPEPLRSCWAYEFSPDGVSDLCLRFDKGLIALVSRKEGGT